MNWLVIFVIICVGLFGWIGYKRGLLKSVLTTGATIIALVLSYALSPTVSQFIRDHTSVDDYIEDKIYAAVESKVGQAIDSTVEGAKEELKKMMEENPDKQGQVSLIRDLGIPDFLEELLLNNNNPEGYKALGVDNVYRYIARSGAIVVVNILAGVLTFILLRLLLMIAIILISKAVNTIAIVHLADKIGGVAAGAILGVVIVWVVMFILSLTMNADAYTGLLKGNSGLQWLHDHNVLMKISLKIPG